MRFMMMLRSDTRTEAGVMPDEKLLTAMGNYNDELIEANAMLAGEGLKPSSKGTLVHRQGKNITVTDGPYSEATELVAGYWIIQVASKQEAIDWARRIPFGAVPTSDEGVVDLAQIYELDDFPVDPAEQPGGWRDEEQRARDAGPPPRKPGTKRYIVMLRGDARTESGELPTEEGLTQMGALIEELVQSGTLLAGEGLKPSSQGARVKFSKGRTTVIDGPYAEAKELVAGFSLIQVASKAEAVDFAKRWLQIHADSVGTDEATIEIRELFELEDIPVDPAEKPDGWRRKEETFRERSAQS